MRQQKELGSGSSCINNFKSGDPGRPPMGGIWGGDKTGCLDIREIALGAEGRTSMKFPNT